MGHASRKVQHAPPTNLPPTVQDNLPESPILNTNCEIFEKTLTQVKPVFLELNPVEYKISDKQMSANMLLFNHMAALGITIPNY